MPSLTNSFSFSTYLYIAVKVSNNLVGSVKQKALSKDRRLIWDFNDDVSAINTLIKKVLGYEVHEVAGTLRMSLRKLASVEGYVRLKYSKL